MKGKVVIVVGGQFGGEGKGKVVAWLCNHYKVDAVVRTGGPNSGHTVRVQSKVYKLRQIPSGILNESTKLYIGAGAVIDLEVLYKEIEECKLDPKRLRIDRNAIILMPEDRQCEISERLQERIASTCTGTGATIIRRIRRLPSNVFAKDIDYLKQFITDVSYELNKIIEEGGIVIVEGTQGFGLSLYHSPYYPYTTGRDTTAAALISEVGLSPLLITHIILVVRTFPIRVGGNSGPLPYEVDWATIKKESGYPIDIIERTTVTNRIRRVARFDLELVKRAVVVNKPTSIALMGVDLLDYSNYGIRNPNHLSDIAWNFITMIEEEVNTPVLLIGTGPSMDDLVVRSNIL